MASSSIEWTDCTWNCVTGCDRVSAGCDHCYALTLAKRLKAMGNRRYQIDGNPTTSGPGFGVTLHPDKLADPLHWRDPQKVFVNSMSDLFHAGVPDEFILKVFAVMAQPIGGKPGGERHTFQILTKRPQRMYRFMSRLRWRFGTRDGGPWRLPETGDRMLNPIPVLDQDGDPTPAPNVWLGTSVENQEAAYRIDWLVKTPAAVRFLSCEPLIGRLDIEPWLWLTASSTAGPWYDSHGNLRERGGGFGGQAFSHKPANDLHWVIAGGESGPGFRPLDLDWVRDLRDQCVEARVPFFFKQVGGIRSKAGGRELDGRTWDLFPIAVTVKQEMTL